MRSIVFLMTIACLPFLPATAIANEDPYFAFFVECLDDRARCRSFPNASGVETSDIFVIPEPIVTHQDFKEIEFVAHKEEASVAPFQLNETGRQRLHDWTKKYVHRRIAIVFEGRVISRLTIREPITLGRGLLSPNLSDAEFKRLVRRLKQSSSN